MPRCAAASSQPAELRPGLRRSPPSVVSTSAVLPFRFAMSAWSLDKAIVGVVVVVIPGVPLWHWEHVSARSRAFVRQRRFRLG